MDLRRANNIEIMLTKVKMPLADMVVTLRLVDSVHYKWTLGGPITLRLVDSVSCLLVNTSLEKSL